MTLDLDLLVDEARAISAVVDRARQLAEKVQSEPDKTELANTLAQLLHVVGRDLIVIASELHIAVEPVKKTRR